MSEMQTLNVRKEKYNKRILGDTKNKKFLRMSNTSEQDKEKYLAIGESDRMTLKFRKPHQFKK